MPTRKLKELLDGAGVKYVAITHSKAFTAPEIAASAHVPGRELAKSVVVKLDGHLALAVLPSNRHVDPETLRDLVGARDVRLASESEFVDAFPGCEVGAMPPFGRLFGMDVFVDETLARDEEIAFNAGTHTELIRMRWVDYERLAKPKILEFSRD